MQVHDLPELEKGRLSSVVLVSGPFAPTASLMAALLTAPSYDHAFIGHPTRGLSRDELIEWARNASPQVLEQVVASSARRSDRTPPVDACRAFETS